MRFFSILVTAIVIAGCQSTQKYQAENCNYDAAYEHGANDAKAGRDLSGETIASKCQESARTEVRKGYREGFDEYSNKHRGFVDIIKDKVKNVQVGEKPKTCMNKKDDTQVCGYGCIESNGDAKCAQSSNHACISSGGKIYCGLNCRETRPGKVSCDETETL